MAPGELLTFSVEALGRAKPTAPLTTCGPVGLASARWDAKQEATASAISLGASMLPVLLDFIIPPPGLAATDDAGACSSAAPCPLFLDCPGMLRLFHASGSHTPDGMTRRIYSRRVRRYFRRRRSAENGRARGF